MVVVDQNHGTSWSLWFEATAQAWSKVQCMTVTDASSQHRVCCAEHYHEYCGRHVCPAAGSTELASEECKLRSAGCNQHTDDAGCDERSVGSGSCGGCKRRDWCTDGGIHDGGDWMRTYFSDRDSAGDKTYDHRQCHYRPSERQRFLSSVAALATTRHDGYKQDDWNEVNMYLGPGDGGANRVFLSALRALVVWRTLNARSRQRDLNDMLRLQAHLDSLGKHVPIIGVRPAAFNSAAARRHWTPGRPLGLSSAAPYALELLRE